ncbi:MAG: hypothetical protein JWM16_2208 [Verrucomicrobiales bacterium]|nr:hypothetical protein [Verrucomicrobiales bacterium]
MGTSGPLSHLFYREGKANRGTQNKEYQGRSLNAQPTHNSTSTITGERSLKTLFCM